MVVHLRKVRKVWGGELTGSLCNRLQTLSEGMNISDLADEVTCKFCRRIIETRFTPSQTRSQRGDHD